MPTKILNISDETYQRHIVLFNEAELVLVLRYSPTVEMWSLDAVYKDTVLSGYRLALNTLHMRSRNMPFDFIVLDSSGTGLDPYRRDDFSTGRCALYLLTPADMELVRGQPVAL
jgi:hypothetical protein